MVWLVWACVDRTVEPVVPEDPPPTARVDTWRTLRDDQEAVRSPGDGEGTWERDDAGGAFVAGGLAQLALRFTAGPRGVDVGGSVVLEPPPFWGWSPPQAGNPDAPGFVTVEGPDGVLLSAREAAGALFVQVGGRALRTGEVLRFVYGAGPAKARVDRFSERRTGFWVGVDADADGLRGRLRRPVEVDVLPGPFVAMNVVAPSVAAPGEATVVRIAALDGSANRTPFVGALTLAGPEAWGPPIRVEMAETDAGAVAVPWVPTVAGVGQFMVTLEDGRGWASNPIVVRDGAEAIAWGDLQIHSGLSDGTGRPSDLLRYAREVAGLDVAAVTDHDRWGMWPLADDPEAWNEIVSAAREAHVDGAFVALVGFEWTNWIYGHRHVLFFGDDGRVLSSLDDATDTPNELWGVLAGQPVVTIAHHPAGGPVALDWRTPPDSVLEPVVEIASVHGQSGSPELPGPIGGAFPDAFVELQWRKGMRFGVIGSTDGHDGHPGLAHLVGGQGGLVAFPGLVRTRQGVLDALRARRVYATNGPRIILRFDVDGVAMGGVVAPGDARVADIRVIGAADLERVQVLTRQGVWFEGANGGAVGRVWAERVTLPPLEAGDFAYVRVIQTDGGLAWASPVFVGEPDGQM